MLEHIDPSLERTATSKPLGPRAAHGLCCASRPKRLPGVDPSAQTLATVLRVAPLIRPASPSDASSLLAIYRPYVESTAVSFEFDVPTEEEFATRITKAVANWHWLVAEKDGQCIAYAYASAHRERPAYRWSTEVSAYVAPGHQRQGLGLALYSELLKELSAKGYCNALAGITLPNEASLALHRKAGFSPVGVFQAVGRKFGQWQDVAWFQRRLQDPSNPESSP